VPRSFNDWPWAWREAPAAARRKELLSSFMKDEEVAMDYMNTTRLVSSGTFGRYFKYKTTFPG
jgi:hypothetical protein